MASPAFQSQPVAQTRGGGSTRVRALGDWGWRLHPAVCPRTGATSGHEEGAVVRVST